MILIYIKKHSVKRRQEVQNMSYKISVVKEEVYCDVGVQGCLENMVVMAHLKSVLKKQNYYVNEKKILIGVSLKYHR